MWIAVKFQSNPEIAGSLRNIFRYSPVYEFSRGRALDGVWGRKVSILIKLRILENAPQESVRGG